MSHQSATYAATESLFATLIAGGVTDVVLSPGSRSTPLAVTAGAMTDLRVHVVLDERSAGFVALGMATEAERPVTLVCTSGSAAANYLPAVVEANRGRVPLVVVTADRPPGFLDRDASQTIEQIDLYGIQVRASVSLPVAHDADPGTVETLVGAALVRAAPPDAGPVHINFPFQKPLEPEAGWSPTPVAAGTGASEAVEASAADVDELGAFVKAHSRGVIVAGPRRANDDELDAMVQLGWPIVADPLSGLRRRKSDLVVTGAELLLRSDTFAGEHRPDAVIRTGGTPTGSATQRWLDGIGAPISIIDPDLRWTATGPEIVLRSNPGALLSVLDPGSRNDEWVSSWRDGERRIEGNRDAEFGTHPGSEVSITRAVIEAEPSLLWAASSMPVRHVDAMLGAGPEIIVRSNRGANGIDGTIASAVGAAVGNGRPATLLIGDLAYLHDVGSLKTAHDLGADLTVVVIDNGGGAIFSMLPIVNHDVDFNRLFITPHGQDLVAIAQGFGVPADRISPQSLTAALRSGSGLRVFVVDADPDDTHAGYERMVVG